jgi:hypothetical protein
MRISFIATALVVALTFSTSASAQRVVTNPGYCAQFYPNANCQNYGPGNPYTDSYRARNWENRQARMGYRTHRGKLRHDRHYVR